MTWLPGKGEEFTCWMSELEFRGVLWNRRIGPTKTLLAFSKEKPKVLELRGDNSMHQDRLGNN